MTDFMVKSETLDRLKPKFEEAKELVMSCISDSRKIIIRHHSDCDGFCAAIALECYSADIEETEKC